MLFMHLFYFIISVVIWYVIFTFLIKKYKDRNLTDICKYDFPIDISFELVKEGYLKRFLGNFFGGKTELEVGDSKFDSRVYISADVDSIRRVLANNEVKDIVLEILADKNINGIYVDNKEITIVSKMFSKNNRHLYSDLGRKYNPYLKTLREILIVEFKKIRVDADRKNFTQNIKNKIEKLKIFYISLLATGLCFVFNFCIADNDIYINLESFSLAQLFRATLSFLVPIILFSLYKTSHSSRRHLLFGSNLWALLPACFLCGFFWLYELNIYLDNSEPKVSTELFHKVYSSANRSTNYYFHLDSSNNPDLEKYSKIKIAVTKYMKFPKNGEAEIVMKKGYFNNPYISIKNK